MTMRRRIPCTAGGLSTPRRRIALVILVVSSSWTLFFANPSQNFAAALFVQPPYQEKPFPLLRLATADRLRVPYKGIAQDAGKAASLPGFALSLNADFGVLANEATFIALQKAYCGWSETKSKVKWKPGRSYTLLDFLPPILQAASGLHFRSSRTPQPGLPSFVGQGSDSRVQKYTQQEVLLTSNCWGFAWEVLFQADNADTNAITISTADPTSAWRAFTGPGFDLIQSSRTKPKLLSDPVLRNRKLKAGDVLLVWHQNPSTASGEDLYLDHVATLIDEDVYYEKSGSGDRVPFRINTWEGLTRNFPLNVFFWEWRRLARNNPLSSNLYGGGTIGAAGGGRGSSVPSQTKVRPATELFGVDAQFSTAKSFLQDRFSVLKDLRPAVAQRLSLQAETGDDGNVEAQTFTGILVLEDLVFDPETGRAMLPPSAFTPEWYMMVQQMLPQNLYKQR